jgi:hypothetical protein
MILAPIAGHSPSTAEIQLRHLFLFTYRSEFANINSIYSINASQNALWAGTLSGLQVEVEFKSCVILRPNAAVAMREAPLKDIAPASIHAAPSSDLHWANLMDTVSGLLAISQSLILF